MRSPLGAVARGGRCRQRAHVARSAQSTRCAPSGRRPRPRSRGPAGRIVAVCECSRAPPRLPPEGIRETRAPRVERPRGVRTCPCRCRRRLHCLPLDPPQNRDGGGGGGGGGRPAPPAARVRPPDPAAPSAPPIQPGPPPPPPPNVPRRAHLLPPSPAHTPTPCPPLPPRRACPRSCGPGSSLARRPQRGTRSAAAPPRSLRCDSGLCDRVWVIASIAGAARARGRRGLNEGARAPYAHMCHTLPVRLLRPLHPPIPPSEPSKHQPRTQ